MGKTSQSRTGSPECTNDIRNYERTISFIQWIVKNWNFVTFVDQPNLKIKNR